MRPHFLQPKKASCLIPYLGKYILCFLLVLVMHHTTFAKERPSFRRFMNNIHLNVGFGYGMNAYENTIANIKMFHRAGNHYLVNTMESNTIYRVRWFGNPCIRIKTYEDISKLLENSGTKSKIVFTGKGSMVPISLSGHMDLLKKLRLELGGSLFINQIKSLKPDASNAHLPDYQDPLGKHYVLRPFVLFGFKLLENPAYTLLLNSQVSMDFTYAQLRTGLATHRSLFPPLGLGLTLEKHISEYGSVFGRVMYDTKSFMEIYSAGKGIMFNQQGIYFQLGFSFTTPEIPRCPLPHCAVEVKHKHGRKPYRGVAMLQGKNARDARLYKK